MITLTNYEMEASLERLEKLQEKGKLGYAIAYNRRKLADAVKDYLETKNEIVIKYGHPVEGKDGVYIVGPEQAATAQKELDEYGFIQHEVTVMQLSLDDFCSGDLTSDDMYALSWIVKEE